MSYKKLGFSEDDAPMSGGNGAIGTEEVMLGVHVSDVKPRSFDGFEEAPSDAPLLNRADTPAYEVSCGSYHFCCLYKQSSGKLKLDKPILRKLMIDVFN